MFGIKIKENCDFGLWMKFIKCANEHISNFLWDDAHLIMEEWSEDIIDCSFLLPNVIGAHPYLLCYTCYYLSRPWRYIFIRYLIRLQNYFSQILILIWLYIRKLHNDMKYQLFSYVSVPYLSNVYECFDYILSFFTYIFR